MSLRYSHEEEVDRHGADEGEGAGFDNLDLSGYAERIFRSDRQLEDVLNWYTERVRDLGWVEGTANQDARGFTRDADEYLQLQILPFQERREFSWSRHYGRSGPFARISLSIAYAGPYDDEDDPNVLAKFIVDRATGQLDQEDEPEDGQSESGG